GSTSSASGGHGGRGKMAPAGGARPRRSSSGRRGRGRGARPFPPLGEGRCRSGRALRGGPLGGPRDADTIHRRCPGRGFPHDLHPSAAHQGRPRAVERSPVEGAPRPTVEGLSPDGGGRGRTARDVDPPPPVRGAPSSVRLAREAAGTTGAAGV